MHPEVIGRPARVIMLDQLIDYIRSRDGVWLTTCEEIARYQVNQSAMLVSMEA